MANVNLPEDADLDVVNEAKTTASSPKRTRRTRVSTQPEDTMDITTREDVPSEDRDVINEDVVAGNKTMTDDEYERYIEQIQNSSEATDSTVIGDLEFQSDFYSDTNVVTPKSPKLNITESDENMSFDDEDDEATENEFGGIEQDDDNENIILRSFADKNQNVHLSNSNPKLQFVDKITVDLNNIVISDKPILNQVSDMNLVFDSTKSTFTVVCCQSSYQASMAGLTLAEKNAINNSESDMFTARQKLYKTIYNKIVSMNFPKPKFDEWLKITSFGDWNTLLFGVYCQTFIDDNDFDITCGECGKVTSITVDNNSMVEARDKRVFEKIDEVVSSVHSVEDLLNNAVIHKHHRIMLKDSKIVVDIASPTLWDHLALIRQSNQKTLQEYADTFSAMLFIKNMYMIDAESSYKTNVPTYYPVTQKAKMLEILLKLSNSDGEQLEDAIEEKLGQYQIGYRIHNATCMHCHHKLPDIPVDMETILFRRINKQRKTTNS